MFRQNRTTRNAAICGDFSVICQKSSFFVFAIEGRPLRDPKTVPRRVPVRPPYARKSDNGRPKGPPSSQQSGRETFFLTFSRVKKRHFPRFALVSGPKMPPERDSWRLRNPSKNRVRGPFWRPKKR